MVSAYVKTTNVTTALSPAQKTKVEEMCSTYNVNVSILLRMGIESLIKYPTYTKRLAKKNQPVESTF